MSAESAADFFANLGTEPKAQAPAPVPQQPQRKEVPDQT